MSDLVSISRDLCREARRLTLSNETVFVYHPLDYARIPHELYLTRYGAGAKDVLFLGMNPGPFGMMQTGVPFGDVVMVRDFLGITGPVRAPSRQHPKRPVDGFGCRRREVSGTRLWGFVKERFNTPEAFFKTMFVVNYCPLVFLEQSGRNRTPDRLGESARNPLFRVCDRALVETVSATGAHTVIGIGAFAFEQAKRALAASAVRVAKILHPSPASPAANRGWAEQARGQLEALGIL